MRNQIPGDLDVKLFAVGHQHAHHAIPAQRLGAQRSHHRAVLAAGDAQHGIAALAVLLKPVPNPFHDLFPDLAGIEFHNDPSIASH